MNINGADLRSHAWWRTSAGLLLIAALLSSLVAWWLIALPVLSLANVPRHAGHFGLLYFHAVGGTVMLLLGALNLYIGSTRKHFRHHKIVGSTYRLGGLLGVMAAVLIMLVKRAHKPESVIFTNSTVSLLTLSFAWFAAALMAYRAVRNKRYDSHMLVYQVPLARYSDTYNGQPLWYVALASGKSYLSLHLMPVYGDGGLARRLADGFRAAGKKLDMGKACIHFKTADDLALDVVAQIVAAVPLDRWVKIAQDARRR